MQALKLANGRASAFDRQLQPLLDNLVRVPRYRHFVCLKARDDLAYDPLADGVLPPTAWQDEIAAEIVGSVDYALERHDVKIATLRVNFIPQLSQRPSAMVTRSFYRLIVSFTDERDAVWFRLRFADEVE